jgi:hypothetical protein
MTSKTNPYASVTCSPAWKIPEPELLERQAVSAKTERNFKINHVGMRRVAIEAMSARQANGEAVGVFQRFNLVIDQQDKPKIAAPLLARIVMHRAERFARERDEPVKFRVYMAGRAEGEPKEWERQIRFTVDPDKLEDDESEEDNDEVDDEEDEERDDEEGDDDEEDEVEDDDEDDDFEDEIELPAEERRIARTQAHPAAEFIDTERQGKLEPAYQLDPAAVAAKQAGLPIPAEVFQFNPQFLLQVFTQGQAMAARTFASAMKQSRLSMRTLRRECSSIMRDSRRTTRMVLKDALQQRDMANRHAEELGRQLIDTTELNAQHYENFQKIAQQGWAAFRHSMSTEQEQFERTRELERIIYGQQIQHAHALSAAADDSAPSAWPGLVRGAAPVVLGGLAFIAAKKGDKELADMLGGLATMVGTPSAQLEDDEEDEDDDEQTESEQAQPSAPGPDAAPPSSPPVTERPTPTRDAARDLYDTLDADQLVKIRETMPRVAWESFEAAASARTESSAVAAVARLDASLRSDVATQMKVLGMLSADQQQRLMKVISGRSRRSVPPRPRASAQA